MTHAWWLPWFGEALVAADAPRKVDLVVVLAGDFYGLRVQQGAQLVREGYAPAALISGPMEIYGQNEADLAIQFARSRGYSDVKLIPFYSPSLSTRDETTHFRNELRQRGARSILLVTSDYHTARSRRLFRGAFGNEVAVYTVPAPDKYFRAASWWQHREGRKIVFYEWTKTLATSLGM